MKKAIILIAMLVGTGGLSGCDHIWWRININWHTETEKEKDLSYPKSTTELVSNMAAGNKKSQH